MAKRKSRHASLADQLTALKEYRNRPEVVEPLQTNWTPVASNDNVDPEDLADLRIERRLEIVPSLRTIVEEMHKPQLRNNAGQVVAIGSLRFSDGTQTERAYTYGPEGKLIRYDSTMPVGAMLGTKESADALSGGSENPLETALSNRYFAEAFGTEPHHYRTGSRKKRKGKSYSRDESAAMLAAAYANTPVLPAIKVCPPALPCSGAKVADSFVGMRKTANGNGGSISWEDVATSRLRRDEWASALAMLKRQDRETIESATVAKSLADLGGVGHKRTAERRGKARLVAANDNLRSALNTAA